MEMRTDLALEAKEQKSSQTDGVDIEIRHGNKLKITSMHVRTTDAAQKLQKPVGNYITIEHMPLTDTVRDAHEQTETLADELRTMLPSDGAVLVAGLGNGDITPDALGVRSAAAVLATRHITGEWARCAGLDNLRPVSVISPGVLGQTGIESAEMIGSIVRSIKPSAVVVIDSLASRSLSRLGCTVQLTDTGISPGAGVQNSRAEISKDTLGVPVIAVGVPTVVDAQTLMLDILGHDKINAEEQKKLTPRGERMIVTPSEIDLLIDRASAIIGMALNRALHKNISAEDLRLLCGF